MENAWKNECFNVFQKYQQAIYLYYLSIKINNGAIKLYKLVIDFSASYDIEK